MKKSLVKNAYFNVIYKLSTIVFPLISAAYASRILLAEGIGIVSSAQNTASYFVSLANLGLSVYGVREIAKNSKNKNTESRIFSELLIISTLLTFFSSILYLFTIRVFIDKNSLLLSYICGLPVFLNFLNIDWFFQGQEEYRYIAFRSILIKVLSLGFILIFIKTSEDIAAYALIVSISNVGNYIFNIIHARKYITFSFKGINLKRHIGPISSLGIVVILSAIYNKIDITMLDVLSTKAIVGYYTNAHKGIDVVLTFCAAITATFLPRLSLIQDNKAELTSLLNSGISVISFIVYPVMMGLIIVSPELVTVLFGSDFSSSATTLRIFSILIVVRVYGDLFSYQLLIALNQERIRIPVAIVATIVNIGLNFILIPVFKQNGAAVASVVSEVIMNGSLLIYVVKHNQLRMQWFKPVLMGLVTSAIMAICCYMISSFLKNPIINLILTTLSGIVIYISINFLFKNDILVGTTKNIRTRKY